MDFKEEPPHDNDLLCPKCKGLGRVEQWISNKYANTETEWVKCNLCEGTGQVSPPIHKQYYEED